MIRAEFKPEEAQPTGQRLNRARLKWQSLTNKYSQNTLTDDELCVLFPPPDWMRPATRGMWCDFIRSYERGQFKRYNMPVLEQYILVILNLRKLTKRLGPTTGLVKEEPEVDSEGMVTMVTKPTQQLELYRRMTLMLTRLASALHMAPRPYIFAIGDQSEEDTLDLELSRSTTDNDRLRLVGGRAMRDTG